MPKDVFSGQWSGSGKQLFRDMSSQRFGRLVVLKATKERRDGHIAWLCQCDCGTKKLISGKRLRSGNTVSCGCGRGYSSRRHGATIGRTKTSEYATWCAMLHRCENPNASDYKFYGGRGIKVCKRWHKFENFLADMGPRSKGDSIERINNDGNYEPSNYKWATHSEQMKNRRRQATASL